MTSHLLHQILPSSHVSLFKKSPQTKVLFGFPIDVDTDSYELLNSKRFGMHAAYLVEMLDTALNMLGPDIEVSVAWKSKQSSLPFHTTSSYTILNFLFPASHGNHG